MAKDLYKEKMLITFDPSSTEINKHIDKGWKIKNQSLVVSNGHKYISITFYIENYLLLKK